MFGSDYKVLESNYKVFGSDARVFEPVEPSSLIPHMPMTVLILLLLLLLGWFTYGHFSNSCIKPSGDFCKIV